MNVLDILLDILNLEISKGKYTTETIFIFSLIFKYNTCTENAYYKCKVSFSLIFRLNIWLRKTKVFKKDGFKL